MTDPFWSTHLSYAEVGRKLGCSRQNVYQQGLCGRIQVDRDQDGKPGVPFSEVDRLLKDKPFVEKVISPLSGDEFRGDCEIE